MACCARAGQPLQGHVVLLANGSAEIPHLTHFLARSHSPLTHAFEVDNPDSILPGSDVPLGMRYPHVHERAAAVVAAAAHAAEAGAVALLGTSTSSLPHVVAHLLHPATNRMIHLTGVMFTHDQRKEALIYGALQQTWAHLLRLPAVGPEGFDLVFNRAVLSPAHIAQQLASHLGFVQSSKRPSKLTQIPGSALIGSSFKAASSGGAQATSSKKKSLAAKKTSDQKTSDSKSGSTTTKKGKW